MASAQGTSTPPAGDANTVVEPIPDPDADGDQPAALVKYVLARTKTQTDTKLTLRAF